MLSGFKKIFAIIMGILTATVFCMNYNVVNVETLYKGNVIKNSLYSFMTGESNSSLFLARERLLKNIDGFALWWDILAIAMIAFYLWNIKLGSYYYRKSTKMIENFFSIIFGIIHVFTNSMVTTGTLDFVFANKYYNMLAVVCIIAYSYFFKNVINIMRHMVDKLANIGLDEERNSKFDQHTYLYSLLIIMISWLPWLIAFYPGSITWDMFNEANQYLGMIPLSNAHPLLSVWIMGWCFEIGNRILNYRFGVFIYILIQSIVNATAYAYYVKLAKEMGFGKKVQFAIIGFYSLVPIWGSLMQYGIKDILYVGMLSWFIGLTIMLYFKTKNNIKIVHEKYAYIIIASLTILLRHNGKLIVFPVLIAMLIIFWNRKKVKLIMAVNIICCCLISFSINTVLVGKLDIPKPLKSESMSIMFQATARCVRDVGDKLTKKEKKVIDGVLNYDKLAEIYVPSVSDNVKGTYKLRNVSKEKELAMLKKYKNVWFSMMKKYPVEYMEAFLAQSYSYVAFVPKSDVPIAVLRPGIVAADVLNTELFDIEYNDITVTLREILNSFAKLFQRIPLIGILYSFALYTWSYILLFLYNWDKKRMDIILLLSIIMLNAIGCVFSPVNGNTRYFLPFMTVFPLIVCWSIKEERGVNN